MDPAMLRPQGASGTSPAASNTDKADKTRKRVYRIGLNIFNRKPENGIQFLCEHGFLDKSPESVARFLVVRKGLSKQMIGEYLGNAQNEFDIEVLNYFMKEIDLSALDVDMALRKFHSYIWMPGESQTSQKLMEAFAKSYIDCNQEQLRQFKNPETILKLAIAIDKLNTDIDDINQGDFINSLRGIDDEADVDREVLKGIYQRVNDKKFLRGVDHVTQVMKVEQTITGKTKPVLVLPCRRLVCYCRLYQIHNPNKKEGLRRHQREVFLFNDILLVTKILSKKKTGITYAFKEYFSLCYLQLYLFETSHYKFGIRLVNDLDGKVLITFNSRNDHDRQKFVEDLKEAILECNEMEQMRIAEEQSVNLDPHTYDNLQMSDSTDAEEVLTEIEDQLDPSMIQMYMRALRQGREKQNTIRVMVVGHHGVGKTTLTKNLMGMSLDNNASTNGVDVHVHKCIASDGKWNMTAILPTESDSIKRIATVAFSPAASQESPKDVVAFSPARSQKAPKAVSDQTSLTLATSEETNVKKVESDDENDDNSPFADAVVDINDDSNFYGNEYSNLSDINYLNDHPNAKETKENVLKFSLVMKMNDSTEMPDVNPNKHINIWDFGGQFVFYATHQLFHTSRAVYLLVLDVTKALDTTVHDDDYPEGSNAQDVKSFCQFWMHSIHSHVGNSKGEPPVILVGTNIDRIEGDAEIKRKHTEDYFDNVRKLFDGTPIIKHIQPEQFHIDNLTTNKTPITELGRCIISVAERQEAWKQDIPAKWIPLECSLRKRRNEKHITFDEVCRIDATNEVPIADRNEIQLFLIYHHLMGTLIYFKDEAISDFVVLDPQWLMDAFKCIITSKAFCKVRPCLRNLWDILVKEAILSPELVDDVWGENTNNDFREHKDILLKYLTKLGIIAKVCVFHAETASQQELDVYIVPSLLKSSISENDVDAFLDLRTSTITSLVFAFENRFVSPTLYHRITAAALGTWPIVEYKGNKLLYENVGIYRLDTAHCGIIELTDKAIAVRVVNLCRDDIDCRQSDMLRRFVELMLIQELDKCHQGQEDHNHQDHRESQYKLYIQCNLENKHCKSIMPIDILRQNKTAPCPDLVAGHVLDSNLVMQQWFPDDYTQGPNQDWFSRCISSGTLSRKVTQRDLNRISKAIGSGWELLSEPLGMSDADIYHFKEDYRFSCKLQIYHMLTMWAQQEGEGATLAVLLQKMKDTSDAKVEWDQIKNMVDEFP